MPLLFAHALQCDVCGQRLLDPESGYKWWRGSLMHMLAFARQHGWQVMKGKYRCPDHKPVKRPTKKPSKI